MKNLFQCLKSFWFAKEPIRTHDHRMDSTEQIRKNICNFLSSNNKMKYNIFVSHSSYVHNADKVNVDPSNPISDNCYPTSTSFLEQFDSGSSVSTGDCSMLSPNGVLNDPCLPLPIPQYLISSLLYDNLNIHDLNSIGTTQELTNTGVAHGSLNNSNSSHDHLHINYNGFNSHDPYKGY